MSYNIDFSVATSEQIEAALCKRLESIRLSRNITQAQLAEEAGVSPRTIGRLEKGQGVSVDTFIRVMMALGIQQSLFRQSLMICGKSVRRFFHARGISHIPCGVCLHPFVRG